MRSDLGTRAFAQTASPAHPLHAQTRVALRMKRPVRRALAALLLVAVAYVVVAYLLLPHDLRRDDASIVPRLDDGLPIVTETTYDAPGDPLNAAFVGSVDAIADAFNAAGWSPADSVTLRSSVRIAEAVLLKKPYGDAPVSPLMLFGRRQDLAFEREFGPDPDRRQHVRLWKIPGSDTRWLAGATFDASVGLSRETGQVTHHIAPDVDDERDRLARDLDSTGHVIESNLVRVRPPVLQAAPARNGGGDPYWTDGMRRVLTLRDPAADSRP